MSLAQGNNTPTRPRIEPGSPDPESDALTTKPVRSPTSFCVCHTNHVIVHCDDAIKMTNCHEMIGVKFVFLFQPKTSVLIWCARIELCHEKTCILHLPKQRSRSAVHPHRLINAFVFHCLDSTSTSRIYLRILNLWLAFVAWMAGLSSVWSQTEKTGLFMTQ